MPRAHYGQGGLDPSVHLEAGPTHALLMVYAVCAECMLEEECCVVTHEPDFPQGKWGPLCSSLFPRARGDPDGEGAPLLLPAWKHYWLELPQEPSAASCLGFLPSLLVGSLHMPAGLGPCCEEL